MKEIDIHLDDIIVNHLVGFFNLKLNASQDPKFSQMNHKLLIKPKKQSSKKYYFSKLEIQSCKMNLTFTYSNFSSIYKRRAIKSSGGTNVVKHISSAIGVTLANIDNAPISLQSLLLENIFHKQSELMRQITQHYKHQIILGVYSIIASFDVIGNPMGLYNNIITGYRDFRDPLINTGNFTQNPLDYIQNVAYGSKSFATNTFIGFTGTASNITGTIGKFTSHFILDQDFSDARNSRILRENPNDFSDGIYLGGKDLSFAIVGGASGIVTLPYQGIKENGLLGAGSGLLRGVIGAPLKSSLGFIDFLTRVSQGLKQSAKLGEKTFSRIRPPRGFGPERLLMVYSLDKAIGYSILASLDDGSKTASDEFHLFHCLSASHVDEILLVSNKTLYVFSITEQNVIFSTRLSCMYKILFHI